MRLALSQIPCVLRSKEENMDRMEDVVANQDADLFIFSELFLTGYMIRDRMPQLAESIDGDSVRRVAAISEAHDSHILFGMATLDELVPGLIRNSAVLVSPSGRVQKYDKLNLANFGPFEEGLYFAKGDIPTLFEVDDWLLGPMICYDIFFPEIAKTYALNGADIGICIAGSPITSRDSFEVVIQARAIENAMFFAYVNQVGCQLNQVYFGGSELVDPRGRVLAKNKYFEEDVSIVEIDKRELELARRMRPTVRDSLSEP